MWRDRILRQPRNRTGNDLLACRAMLCAVASMIQLTFQPAFDPYHAVFRALRLRPLATKEHSLHRDHMRILDFYLLFPFRIDGIRLRREDRKYRRLATEYERSRPYGEQPE